MKHLLLAVAAVFHLASPISAHDGCKVHRASGSAEKGFATAELVALEGGIAVVRLVGDYDRNLPDGSFNEAPRLAVAAAALEAFGDEVDFLAVLSSFDFDRGAAEAFAVSVANDVEGIGETVFDDSAIWGSSGRLQLYTDLGPIAERELDPVRPEFERTLTITLHELFHRWLFSASIEHPSLPADALRGAGAHWSFLADSHASLLYGASWRDDGDGGHTAVQTLRRLSPLDLYLSGFFDSTEVPPVRVIVDPLVDPQTLPTVGARAFGPVEEVAIDDVLAALGPRQPAASDAPKHFRVGLVVLVREAHEEVPLPAIARLGSEVATRFAILTAGRGTLAIAEAPTSEAPGSPDPVGGDGGATLPTADLGAAVAWLRATQQPDGSWADTEATRTRDTALAVRALVASDGSFVGTPREAARDWLRSAETETVDALAHALIGALAVDPSPSEHLRRADLLASAGEIGLGGAQVGQWGPGVGHATAVLDTALATRALSAAGPLIDDPSIGNPSAARLWLVGQQNTDGGWAVATAGSSRLGPTAHALSLLAVGTTPPGVLDAATGWLANQQNADGGFGDDSSDPWATALALDALLESGRLGSVDAAAAANYLRSRQRLDGSWEGSVGVTAAAVSLLPRLTAADLGFLGTPQVIPSTAAPGEPIRLGVEVVNRGSSPSPPTTLRWSLESEDGEVVGEIAVPGLLPVQRVFLELNWDTSTVPAGDHSLFAVLDPDNLVAEANELDNVTSVLVSIAEPPLEADLVVTASEIALSPRHPDHLPSEVELLAVVRNVGLTPVVGARVVVAAVDGGTFADVEVDVAALSTVLVEATIPVVAPAPFEVAVLVDPDDLVEEDSEDNNLAVVSIEPSPTYDAVVEELDVLLDPVDPLVGELLQVEATVRNRGILDIPALSVRVDVLVDELLVFTESWTEPVEVLGTTRRVVPWLVDRTGAARVVVTADPTNQIAELDEANNTVSIPFPIADPSDPNLAVDPILALNPDPPGEGLPLLVSTTISNTGGVETVAFEVALYDGDPATGGIELDRTQVAGLAVGATTVIELGWDEVPNITPRLLFVVADPENLLTETREDDNLAWIEIRPARFPDLAVSPTSVSLNPAFPVGGESAEIRVEVANLGGQLARDVLVRATVDAVLIGEMVLSEVAADSVAPATIPWTTPEDQAGVELAVEIDPLDTIHELSEDNNTAITTVVLQGGAASVSERYFSPNGDGIKDTTLLTFRLEAAEAVVVEVRDRYGRVRREEDLGVVSTGTWSWDGKDGFGRVVQDGDWTVALVGPGGDRASVLVTLDTNRSPWSEALGTGFEAQVNLTCHATGTDRAELSGDDHFAYLLGNNTQVTGIRGGIHRTSALTHADLEVILRNSLGPGGSTTKFVLDRWRGDIALRRSNGALSFTAADGHVQPSGINASPESFLPESGDLVVWTGTGHARFDRLTGAVEPLPRFHGAVHPVRDRYVGWLGSDLVLVDASTGAGTLLQANAPEPLWLEWSPDGRQLGVVLEHADGGFGQALLFTQEGQLVRELVTPNLVVDLEWYGQVDLPGQVRRVSWSTVTPELVVDAIHEIDCGWLAAVWLFDTFDSSWELLGSSLGQVGCESFVVSVTGSNEGLEQVLHFPPETTQREVDLRDLMGPIEVRLEHRGRTLGLLDSVVLDTGNEMQLPSEIVDGGADDRARLARPDGDELDLTGQTLVLRWEDADSPTKLVILAREPMAEAHKAAGPKEGSAAAEWTGAPHFVPWTRTVALLGEESVTLVDLDDPERELRSVLEDHWYFYRPRFSASGKALVFNSPRDLDDADSACYDQVSWIDEFVHRSLLNLENRIEVRPRVGGGPGYVVLGSAADKNFHRRWLEAAPVARPWEVTPVGVPSSMPVVDGELGVWAPSAPGSWLVRQVVEDRGGNVRTAEQRVEVGSVAAIANLAVQPGVFSPHLGNLEITFDLLAPVQADIQVVDWRGVVVRTLPVSLPCCVGDTVVFTWDGRDDFGRLSADGHYVLLLLGFEVPFELDATAPAIATLEVLGPAAQEDITVLDAQGRPSQVVVLTGEPILAVNYLDPWPQGGQIDRGYGEAPLLWAPVGSLVPPAGGPRPVIHRLALDQSTGARFRVSAWDAAGNQAQDLSELVPEELALWELGPIIVDAAGQRQDTMIRVGPPGLRILRALTALGMAESIVGELASVLIETRPWPGGVPWSATPVEEFLDRGGVTLRSQAPNAYFEIPLRLELLTPGTRYDLRVRAIDPLGTHFVSPQISVVRPAVQLVGRASPMAQRPDVADVPEVEVLARLLISLDREDGRGLMWGRHWLDRPIATAVLKLQSVDSPTGIDPRYASPVAVPLLASLDNVLVFELPVDLSVHYAYNARIVITQDPPPGSGGPPILLESPPVPVRPAPVDIEIRSMDPYSAGETCHSRYLDRWDIDLRLHLPGDEQAAVLAVERRLPGGGTDTVLTLLEPDFEPELVLDTSAWPVGVHSLVFRLATVAGTIAETLGSVVVDRSVPSVQVLSPAPGTIGCGQLSVQVRVSDTAQTLRLSSLQQPLQVKPYGTDVGPLVPAGIVPIQETVEVPLAGAVRDLAEAWLEGFLVRDQAGNSACLMVPYGVDLGVKHGQFALEPESFSPNGDGKFDTSTFSLPLLERVNLGFEVLTWAEVPIPVTQLQLGWLDPGLVAWAWDGRAANGLLVADGQYLVMPVGQDECGHSPDARASLLIDTQPPVAVVVSPSPGATLPIVAEIWATLVDDGAGVGSWSIEYIEDASQSGQMVATGEGPAHSPERIAVWNTFGLQGSYTLRLVLEDKVGNSTEVLVPVVLGSPDVLLSDLDASPSPFSPNNDGRREAATIRFAVETEARIRLLIQREDETLVRVLADSTRQPGIHTVTWDGLGAGPLVAPDARYRVVAEAYLVGDPALVQDEVVTLDLDATPPTLEITLPEPDSHHDLPLSIEGSVTDPLLGAWALALAPAGSEEWTILAEGTDARSEVALAVLDQDQAEGPWQLRFEAEDSAENRSGLLVPFTIDRTPPEVSISTPANGSLFGPADPAIAIEGEAYDLNLATGSLVAFPEGSELPGDRVVLAEGDTSIEGALGTLEALGFADGAWTIELAAEDLAGHRSTTSVTVALDRTPPTVAIDDPGVGAWIRAPQVVLGNVADPHLLEWRLAVAAGATPAPGGFATVAAGFTPVDGALGTWILLPPDGPATLQLHAIDAVGNESTVTTVVQVDTTPPPRPLHLTAERIVPRDVQLDWNLVADPNLAGYVLDRGSLRITPTPVPGPSWIDTEVPDGIHEYRVRAVDLAGNESEPSAPAIVAIDTTPPLVSISAPPDGGWIRGLTEIVGTATTTQDDFDEYWIEVGSDLLGWNEIRRSPAPVQAAPLANWTPAPAHDGENVTIRLSAVDLAGNEATTAVTVQVDLSAPPAPIDLVAVPAPAPSEDVILTWTATTVPDLAGYVVLRDGAALFPSDTPIEPTTWTDVEVPDGTFTWTVVALDHAANQSAESNPATLTLDRHPPRAVVVRPVEGHEFDGSLVVLATSEDRDVETLELEWRLPGGTWTALAPTFTAEPWTATLDPLALLLERGPIELRAVATDFGGQVDPAPAVTTAIYADLTPPPTPLDLLAAIDGDVATLTWDPVDPDAIRWRVEALFEVEGDGSWTETVAEVEEPTATLSDLELRLHRWQVVAIDAVDNESDPSLPADGLVHRPHLERHLTPRLETLVDLRGSSEVAPATLELTHTPASGAPVYLEVPLAADGQIDLPEFVLQPGDQSVVVRARDAAGNRSLPDTLHLLVDEIPSTPTNLAVEVDELEATLSWDPSPDADHLGWRVIRGDEVTPTPGPIPIASAEASDWSSPPEWAIDGDTETWWSPWDPDADHLELGLAGPEIVDRLELTWHLDSESVLWAPTSLNVEAWDGRDWIPVGAATPDAGATWHVAVVRPYRTDRLRLHPRGALAGDSWEAVRLAEVVAIGSPVLVGPPVYLEQPGDGHWTWEVEAVDLHGFVSPRADVTADVGDVEPPLPVLLSGSVDGSDVLLSWTASESPDVVAYDLRRDGVLFLRTPDLATVDADRPNGEYQYEVRALDAAFNESPPSNVVTVVVAIEGPTTPIELSVSADPAGGALDLDWTWSAPELPAGGFRVRRSLVQGGPWTPHGASPSLSWRDEDVDNGTTYYYVVEALDALGNPGEPSNEASGTPQDLEAPAAPRPTFPAIAGGSASTYRSSLPFAAFAEPGASVRIIRNGIDAMAALAAPSTSSFELGAAAEAELLVPSPDGRFVVVFGWFESEGEWDLEARLLDSAGAIVATLPYDSVAWYRDGSALLGWRGGELWSYDLAGASSRLWTSSAISGAVVVGFDSAIVLAEDEDFNLGFHRLDLTTRQASLLALVNWDEIPNPYGDSMVLSPDAAHLAFEDWNGVALLDLDTGLFERLAWNASSPSWSPDGRFLVWSTSSGPVVLDRDTSVETPFGGADERRATWSPDGTKIVAIDDADELVVRRWPDAERLELGLTQRVRSVVWPASGLLVVSDEDSWTPSLITPAGLARFGPLPLFAGEEAFPLVAVDAGGNRSPTSLPVWVERLAPSAPDLIVPAFGLGAVPAAPMVGEMVRFTASVLNAGDLGAGPSRIAASLVRPDGTVVPLLDLPIPALAPGESAVRDVTVPMPGPVGLATLVVDADSTNQVIESNETNNRGVLTVPVGLAGSAALAVVTDRSSYGPGMPVTATTTVVGGGGSSPLSLRWWIVDSAGVEVAQLPTVELGVLAASEEREISTTWGHELVFAGPYRVVARVVDSSAETLAEASADFGVSPWHSVLASVLPRPSSAVRGAAIDLDGRIEYLAGNDLLVGTTATLEVVDGSGSVEHQSDHTLGALLPTSVIAIASRWESGGAPAGMRTVRLSLHRDGLVLASAAALLELQPAPADLRGTITSALPEVPLGDPLEWQVTLRNLGDLELANQPVRVRMLDGETLAELALEASVRSIDAGGEMGFTGTFPSDELAPGSLLLVLEGEIDLVWSLLAQHSLFAVDRTPPELEVWVPTPNQLLGPGARMIARAGDVHGAPVVVDYRVDGGAALLASPLDPVEATFAGPLEGDEGPHQLVVSATDSWSNRTTSEPIPFVLDLTPPVITILGVVDGEVSLEPVVPVILVEDPHLDHWSARLDGFAFTSGTEVTAAGNYELVVVATDLVGNHSEVSLGFTIATAVVVDATLVDHLHADLDADGLLSPGDLLRYQLQVEVAGAGALDLRAVLPVPAGTILEPGSVSTDRGVVESQSPPTVLLGDLASGESATVELVVRLEASVGDLVTAQGFVSGDAVPAQPSDDPDLPGERDPTISVVGLRPYLVATKTAQVLAEGGIASLGEDVSYTIHLTNAGTAPATEVELLDAFPHELAILPSTVVLSRGAISSLDPLLVELGSFAPGESAVLGFEARVVGPLTPGAEHIENQGQVSSAELPALLTDDPSVPGPADPTRVPLVVFARPTLELVVDLLVDHDQDGALGPGDSVLYRLEANARDVELTALDLELLLPSWALVRPGSVTTNLGTVVSLDPLALNTTELPAREGWRTSFEVELGVDAPEGAGQLVLQASLLDSAGLTVSDDPRTTAPGDPTVLSTFRPPLVSGTGISVAEGDNGSTTAELVLDFVASPQGGSITWSTRDGSATAGADYVSAAGVLEIEAAATSATITVEILGDELVEGDEHFFLDLVAANGFEIATPEMVVTILDDDQVVVPPVVSLAAGAPVTEGDPLIFTLARTETTVVSRLLVRTLLTGTATPGVDFEPVADLVVELAEGVTSLDVLVTTLDDAIAEREETVVLEVVPIAGAEVPVSTAVGTILDENGPVVLSLAPASADEGDDLVFVLSATPAAAYPVEVVATTRDVTATATADYLPMATALTIPAGVTSVELRVVTLEDDLIEGDEVLELVLSSPVDAVLGVAVGSGTIRDLTTEQPPTIDIGDTSALESAAVARFELVLSHPVSSAVTVPWATANGTASAGEDYVAATGSVVFAAGETAAEIVVALFDDSVDEADETLMLLLGTPSYGTLLRSSAVGTILDDDVPAISIGDVSVEEGDTGLVSAVFPVTLSLAGRFDIVVEVATVDETATAEEDYLPLSGTLTVPAGEVEAELVVEVIGDVYLEPNETLTAELFAPSYGVLARGSAVGTIVDDEICLGPELLRNGDAEEPLDAGVIPGWYEIEGNGWRRETGFFDAQSGDWYLAPEPAAEAELAQELSLGRYAARIDGTPIGTGGQLFAFEVWLRTGAEEDSDAVARVVLEYRDGEGSLLSTRDSGELVSPEVWYQFVDLHAAPVGARSVRVRLLAALEDWSEEEPLEVFFDDAFFASVRAATLSIDDVAVLEGHSGTTETRFPLRLACALPDPLEVGYATADGSALAGLDYLEGTGTVVLAPGDTEADVVVAVIGDLIEEPDKAFSLQLELSEASPAVLLRDEAIGTIVDDDEPATGFCPRSPGYWKNHVSAWPVSQLTLGASTYDVAGVLALLQYGGPDAATKLARALSATKLNQASGYTAPGLADLVAQADLFLSTHPPGSNPRGAARNTANTLKDALETHYQGDCPEPQVCADQPLGPASGWNVFVLGTVNQSNSDTEGRMAAGGSVQLQSYSVGLLEPPEPGLPVLVAGSHLLFSNGTVSGGDVVYGQTAQTANLTVPHGVVRQGVVVDFAAAGVGLDELSTRLAALPSAGGVTVEPWGAITLVGGDPELNVFALSSAQLQAATSLTVQVPAGATAVVNVSGSSAVMQYFGFNLIGVDSRHLLWHFPQATSFIAQGIGVEGSVLAPKAAVQFNNGVIHGALVAASLQGNGQSNRVQFEGCLPRP